MRNGATGEVIYTPPDDYDTILNLMKNLEEYLNDKDDLSTLIKLAVQHYQFESIHPFYDGNGRTGRIINVLYLMLVELLFEQPYCRIEYVIERLGVSRITASKYLKGLEEIGKLESRRVWKEILYINTNLFALLKS